MSKLKNWDYYAVFLLKFILNNYLAYIFLSLQREHGDGDNDGL